MKLNLVKSSNFAANLASLLEFIIGFRLDKRIGNRGILSPWSQFT